MSDLKIPNTKYDAINELNGWTYLGETDQSIYYWNCNDGRICRKRYTGTRIFRPKNYKKDIKIKL